MIKSASADNIELEMFGCNYDTFRTSVLESPDSKLIGIEFAIVSLLSDVQEMIAHDMKEDARQSLNRIKRLIFEQIGQRRY